MLASEPQHWEMQQLEAGMAESAGTDLDYSEGCILEEFSEDELDEMDTTAEGLQAGDDMQGILWEQIQLQPDTYRRERLQTLQRNNYFNVLTNKSSKYAELLKFRASFPAREVCFYNFVRNFRSGHSKVVHFQLRNLLWATSKNDVFVVFENMVNHWSPITKTSTPILNLSGVPHGPSIPGVGKVQITTLCVQDNFLAAGGFNGELVCKRLGQPGLAFSGRVTQLENGITNGIEIPITQRLGPCLMTSNNDMAVRLFDINTFKIKSTFCFPWAVNYATVNPVKGDVIAVVGDDTDTVLTDPASGATVARLKGHLDFSFAVSWHPEGHLLATGNQDTTSIVWDIRHTQSPLVTLPGTVTAIRSTRFSPDGRFLAVSEATDYVHMYDVKSGFMDTQTIAMFGEISGISYTPESQGLFVGISDVTYCSIASFERYAGGDDTITNGPDLW